MSPYLIELIKETPHHPVGAKLTPIEFRGYYLQDIGLGHQTMYLPEGVLLQHLFKHITENGFTFFKIGPDTSNPPNAIIYNDIYYTKEFDGCYRAWVNPSHRNAYEGHRMHGKDADDCRAKYPPLAILHVQDIRAMLTKAAYTQLVLHSGDNINDRL